MKHLALASLLLCGCLSSSVEDTARELCAEEIEGQLCYLRCSGPRFVGTLTGTTAKIDVVDAGTERVNQLQVDGPLISTAAGASHSFNSTAAGANITMGTSAANAGATPATAAFSVFPSSALDATDWVFNVANAANGTSLFNIAYNGAVTFPVSANPLILNVASTGNIKLNARMAIDVNAPTISSGFGSSPSIVNSNGTLAFQINVGTGGVATSGVIGLPSSATNGWNCFCDDITTPGANRTRMTANSTTTCTVTNVAMSTGSAAAWTASDKLWCSAFAN